MRKFQIWWIKLGCFLTGYDFYVLSNCSEVAIRRVKKYTAALFLITLVWAFIGFSFCDRYLDFGLFGSIIGAIIACFAVIQIERQVLMAEKSNWILSTCRIGLAILMAVIGSLIIDQIIFQKDINREKLNHDTEMVNELLPKQSKILNSQINSLDSSIIVKNNESIELDKELTLKPFIEVVETSVSSVPLATTFRDSLNKKPQIVIGTQRTKQVKKIENPKMGQRKVLADQIALLMKQKADKETDLLLLQDKLMNKLKDNTGFIDELNVMIEILKKSGAARMVYAMWILFFFIIEIIILATKRGDKDSDYELVIAQQMEMHQRKILLLNDPHKMNSSN